MCFLTDHSKLIFHKSKSLANFFLVYIYVCIIYMILFKLKLVVIKWIKSQILSKVILVFQAG